MRKISVFAQLNRPRLQERDCTYILKRCCTCSGLTVVDPIVRAIEAVGCGLVRLATRSPLPGSVEVGLPPVASSATVMVAGFRSAQLSEGCPNSLGVNAASRGSALGEDVSDVGERGWFVFLAFEVIGRESC